MLNGILYSPFALGDTVFFSSFVFHYMRMFPKAEYTVFVPKNLQSFYRYYPRVRIRSTTRTKYNQLKPGLYLLYRHWLFRQTWQILIGYKKTNFLQSLPVYKDKEGFSVQKITTMTLDSISPQTFENKFQISYNPYIPFSDTEKMAIQRETKGNPYIVIAPFTTEIFKSWALEKFAQVISHIHNRWPHYQIYIVGGEQDRTHIGTFLQLVPDKIVPFVNQPIPTLAALIKNAYLYLGLDSGPFQIAVAVGTNAVCLGNVSPSIILPHKSPHALIVSTTDNLYDRAGYFNRLQHARDVDELKSISATYIIHLLTPYLSGKALFFGGVHKIKV